MTAEQLKAAIRAEVLRKDAFTSNGAFNTIQALDILIDEFSGGGGGGGATPGIDTVLAEAQALTISRFIELNGHSLRFSDNGSSNEDLFQLSPHSSGDISYFETRFDIGDGNSAGIRIQANEEKGTFNITANFNDQGSVGINAEATTDGTLLEYTADTHTFDGNVKLLVTSVPGAANATGETGQFSWDANFIYMCISPNTWKRTAIATW